jgi:hypothetical protein
MLVSPNELAHLYHLSSDNGCAWCLLQEQVAMFCVCVLQPVSVSLDMGDTFSIVNKYMLAQL